MLDCDPELDVPTTDELLAEIGLDARTIRRIRTEAGDEESLSIG